MNFVQGQPVIICWMKDDSPFCFFAVVAEATPTTVTVYWENKDQFFLFDQQGNPKNGDTTVTISRINISVLREWVSKMDTIDKTGKK